MVNVTKLKDRRDEKVYSLRKGVTSLGTESDNNIVYRPEGVVTISRPLVIDGRTYEKETQLPESVLVSPYHCKFHLNGDLQVEDTSKTGVYVNDMLVGNGMRVKLKEGDKIKIGKRTLEVVVDESVITKAGKAVLDYIGEAVSQLVEGPKTVYDLDR